MEHVKTGVVADVETGGLGTEIDCAICLNASEMLCTALRTTECGHTFCQQCLGRYAISKPPNEPVPCPMCRAPLAQDDIPHEFTIKIGRLTPDTALGMVVKCTSIGEGGGVHVASVEPGSPAAEAGLHAGLRLLAVDGSAIDIYETAHQVVERFCDREHPTEPVQLLLSWRRPHVARPATSIELSGTGWGQTDPPPDNQWRDACCLSMCCCCAISGQLWHRVVAPRSRWTCYAVAAMLYLLHAPLMSWELYNFLFCNTGCSDRSFLASMFTLSDVNLDDGVTTRNELGYYFIASAVPLWLIGATLLRIVRVRLERDHPRQWAHATVGRQEATILTHTWAGPYCACWCLAAFLLSAFVDRTDWSPFGQLRAAEEDDALVPVSVEASSDNDRSGVELDGAPPTRIVVAQELAVAPAGGEVPLQPRDRVPSI